jgi:TetR/AcrR family transcriptional repressor of nem operon
MFMESTVRTSKTKILDAALQVIRSRGNTAATIEDICAAAGVIKGKLELALSTVQRWNTLTGALFASAPYQQIEDPRERLLAYIDFRASWVQGDLPDFTCLLGTMVQETFETNRLSRDAGNTGIALHAQVVIQGALILAKAQGSAEVALMCIDQLRGHVAALLNPLSVPKPKRSKA